MKAKVKAVKIEWIDSTASDMSWMLLSNLPEDFEPVKIVSFGVVIKETDEYISIAQNYGTNPEQCCSLMTIPKGCIKKIRTIEEIIKDEK